MLPSYSTVIDQSGQNISFHRDCEMFEPEREQRYQMHMLKQFRVADLNIVIVALILYLLFGIADFTLHPTAAPWTFGLRTVIALTLLPIAYWLPRSRFSHCYTSAVVIATPLILASVLLNTVLLEYPEAYFYHLAILPFQAFCIMALRMHFRAQIICSCLNASAYLTMLCILVSTRGMPALPGVTDSVIEGMLPFYFGFCFSLMVMGILQSHYLESRSRSDFVRKELVDAEQCRLQEMVKEFDRLSNIDGLTGLFNRRALEQRLENEIKRHQRSGQPLTVLMVDVDYFKSINDCLGHEGGDRVLRCIASVLQQQGKRPGDFCGRYGGEEFVLVFTDCNESIALELADRLSQAIVDLAIENKAAPEGIVTVSIGAVASRLMASEDHVNIKERLLKSSDDALYQAKNNGRNQYCMNISLPQNVDKEITLYPTSMGHVGAFT